MSEELEALIDEFDEARGHSGEGCYDDYDRGKSDQVIRRARESSREKDARITELTAEVAKYRAALVDIVATIHWTDAERIARNALREVG